MKLISLIIIPILIGLSSGPVRSSTQDSLQQEIVVKEREELDTLKTGDVKAFANLIADEAVFVDARGSAGKAEVVSHVTYFRLLGYSIEDLRFVRLSETSGIIAYKLIEKGSSHGREFTVTAHASAVWVKRDGKWLCVFSQETAGK